MKQITLIANKVRWSESDGYIAGCHANEILSKIYISLLLPRNDRNYKETREDCMQIAGILKSRHCFLIDVKPCEIQWDMVPENKVTITVDEIDALLAVTKAMHISSIPTIPEKVKASISIIDFFKVYIRPYLSSI